MVKPNLNVVSETAFKIDTDIPAPPSRSRGGKYPFGAMEVGHSFAFTKDNYVNAAAAASWFGKRNNRKYSIRKDGDGYRCWRIA